MFLFSMRWGGVGGIYLREYQFFQLFEFYYNMEYHNLKNQLDKKKEFLNYRIRISKSPLFRGCFC